MPRLLFDQSSGFLTVQISVLLVGVSRKYEGSYSAQRQLGISTEWLWYRIRSDSRTGGFRRWVLDLIDDFHNGTEKAHEAYQRAAERLEAGKARAGR